MPAVSIYIAAIYVNFNQIFSEMTKTVYIYFIIIFILCVVPTRRVCDLQFFSAVRFIEEVKL